jgi:hypothetical protein
MAYKSIIQGGGVFGQVRYVTLPPGISPIAVSNIYIYDTFSTTSAMK